MENPVYIEDLMEFIDKMRSERETIWEERRKFIKDNPKIPAATVLDENKTVRWNRDEVKRRNDSVTAKLAVFTRRLNKCDADFAQKVKEYIRTTYGFGETLANIVFRKAYEDGHACGYEDVVAHAQEYGDFAEQIVDAMT